MYPEGEEEEMMQGAEGMQMYGEDDQWFDDQDID